MSKHLRVKVSYSGESDKDVAAEAVAVVDGLTGNAAFPKPPVDPADLKAAVEAYASAIATAIDGGKKAIVARDKQREVVVCQGRHPSARWITVRTAGSFS